MNKTAPHYDYKQWRERFILLVLRFASLLGVVLIGVSYTTATPSDRILFPILYLILLAATVTRVPYTARAYLLLLMLLAIGVNSQLSWGPWLDGSIFLMAFVGMAALLFDNYADIAAMSIGVLVFVILGALHQTGYVTLYSAAAHGLHTNGWDWVTYAIDFIIPSLLLIYAIREFKKEFASVAAKMQAAYQDLESERRNLEERVHERTTEIENRNAQMRSSNIVARSIAEIRNIEDLMNTITTLASEQFGYTHIGLYLLDENQKTAFLQAASSEAGKQLIGQAFHIEPNRNNPIYAASSQNRVHISSETSGGRFLKDENFPNMRSRMALPLSVQDKMVGVLDIHSNDPQAFSEQDAEIMQTLADLAAIAIDNVRLMNETKSLINQLEANTSFQSRQTWSKITSRQTPAYLYTPAGIRPIFAPQKSGVEKDAESLLQAPLTLHGQTIGKIKLKRKGMAAHWSERERDLVEKIAYQVSLALENSRLVEEAQKSALRDKMIANVSTHVRETLEIESVIRTAAAELRKVFDLKEAEISVGARAFDAKNEA